MSQEATDVDAQASRQNEISNSRPGNHPDPLSDGFALQVAIDGMASGDMEALKHWLARKEGLDPDKVSLQSTPWKAPNPEDENAPEFTFIGQLDDVKAPGEANGITDRPPPPTVIFDSVANTFQYNVLNPTQQEIRLLRLASPDDEGVTRELELHTFSLNDVPRFFCLSYVWGNPDRFLPITCNGAQIKVTQNLFHALKTCFNRFSEAWLWADGICINQENIEERSQQVMLMGTIYRQASMVLAHPGHFKYAIVSPDKGDQTQEDGTPLKPKDDSGENREKTKQVAAAASEDETENFMRVDFNAANDHHEDDAREAISIMTYLCRIWSSWSDFETRSDAEWAAWEIPDFNSEDGRAAWEKLYSFWSQDWFSRAWVLQELVLAAKVVVLYGDAVFSLDALLQFWTEARRHGMPRVLRIGALADACIRVMHLSPVGQLKTFREKHRGGEPDEDQVDVDTISVATSVEGESEFDRGEVIKGKELEDNDGYGNDGTVEDAVKRTADGVKKDQVAPKEPARLLDLLALTRMSLATDNRDRVYALLGLADEDPIAQSIVPDYSPENTTLNLFVDVARRFVEAGLGSALLHHAGLDAQITGLPSWVPDWTFQSRSTLDPQLYRCMGSTAPKISLLKGENELPKVVIRGAPLAPIKFVGPAWRFYSHNPSEHPFSQFVNAKELEIPPFNDEDARNFILTMGLTVEKDVAGSSAKRYASEGWDKAMARTLVCDRSWDGERIGAASLSREEDADPSSNRGREKRNAEFFDALEAFREFYNEGPNSEEDLRIPGVRVHETCIFKWLLRFDEKKEDELQQRMIPFTNTFQDAHRGRRFAVLSGYGGRRVRGGDKGFIATVPYNTEKGDMIVMFEGFSTPFVLRKGIEDAEGEYRVVGDCYVHGVMDGELIRPVEGVQEELGDNQVMADGQDAKVALWTPKGYAVFRDMVIT